MSTIAVFGAGSIGCYVGGCLAAGGSNVLLIGRERIIGSLREHGLHVTDYLGRDDEIAPTRLQLSTDPSLVAQADLVLVTVKSAATAQAAQEIRPLLRPGAVILSLQNGLSNADVLQTALPDHTVVAGMVPFNVVNQGNGHFHQGTEGTLDAAHDAALVPYLPEFQAAGLTLHLHRDMPAILWAKLLLNLNNAINALCGQPLKQELSQRQFRRCLAMAQEEALELMSVAGIRPAKLTPIPPRLIPKLLRVPDVLFRLLANKMLEIDPEARSSMWEDLELGRPTEVDWISGEVLKLATRLGRRAPVNERLVQLIKSAEQGGRRNYSADELLAELSRP